MEERQRRKLAVILHADVVGSTRLVHRNESLAHHRIQDSFRRFSETIKAYSGLTHELRGDALVAEFSRASDAVCAAVNFQLEHAESLLALSDDIKPEIRIGISLGEVVIADNTVTGGGVVLAQRVEQLAEPGGICITAAIHEALPQHMPFDQFDLGEQEVKGFEEAIRVYRVALRSGQVVPPPEKDVRHKSTNTLRVSVAVATIVLIIAGGLTYWFQPWAPKEEPASVERMAFPLPDKPSIAILPFSDLSDSADHTYIADGLTENIIATLGKISGLFVIDRGAVSRYNDGVIKARRVSEELGVRYVLKGGVQKSADRLRVTATLVDTSTGHHVWSERYDRKISDLFAVQDEITGRIVVELQVNLTEGEQARLKYDSTINFEAWENFVRASKFLYNFTKEDNAKARDLFERAVDLDPQYAVAWSWLAWTHWIDARFGYSESREVSFSKAEELAAKAVELDPELADALSLLGAIHLYKREYDEALDKGRMAMDLSPNNSLIQATVAVTTYSVGDWVETIELLKRAMRLSPYYPSWYLLYLGRAQTFQGDYKEAIATHEKGLTRAGNPYMKSGFHAALAFAHMEAGNEQQAREFFAQTLEVMPHYSASYVKKTNFFKDTNDLDHLVGALRRAGMPEHPPPKLPDKPSIAVLPFTNMSGDPAQGYFSDGISEDIITDLSQISSLGVIARNSSFAYRDTPLTVQDIGKELGVKYVLEGSIRKSGDRLRITAKLIDAGTNQALWAHRYDRLLVDIFDLQDEITNKIVSALSIKLIGEESTQLYRRSTNSFEAYDLFLQGLRAYQEVTLESLDQAEDLYLRVIERDPGFARAYGALGITLSRKHQLDFTAVDRDAYLDRALDAVRKAVSIEPTSPQVLWASGFVHMWLQDFDKAAEAVEKAVALSPNYADGWGLLALLNNQLGRGDQALRFIRKAVALNPKYTWEYPYNEGRAYYVLGDLDKAVAPLSEALERNEYALYPRLFLTASYAGLDQLADAEWEVTHLEVMNPGISLSHLQGSVPISEGEHRDRFFEDLRKAGLPQ